MPVLIWARYAAQAANLLATAQREAVEIRRRAEQDGRADALRTAEAQLDERIGKQMTNLLPALTEAVQGIVQARQTWLAHSEVVMVKVATAIASRIVRREIQHQPDIPLTLIREALEMAAGSTQIELRLNPADHAALAGQVKTLVAQTARAGGAEVIADPAISPAAAASTPAWARSISSSRRNWPASNRNWFDRLAARCLFSPTAIGMKDVGHQHTTRTTAAHGDVGQRGADRRHDGGRGRLSGAGRALVEIDRHGGKPLSAEVIGFRDDLTIAYLLDEVNGIRRGNPVRLTRTSRWLRVGPELLGRVVDATAATIDGRPQPTLTERISLQPRPLPAVQRPRIDAPISTGIRVIDGLLTCGPGSGWESLPARESARA